MWNRCDCDGRKWAGRSWGWRWESDFGPLFFGVGRGRGQHGKGDGDAKVRKSHDASCCGVLTPGVGQWTSKPSATVVNSRGRFFGDWGSKVRIARIPQQVCPLEVKGGSRSVRLGQLEDAATRQGDDLGPRDAQDAREGALQLGVRGP